MTARAVLHTTGPRVHYAMYPAEENRLSGPFRSKRAAQAVIDAANLLGDDTDHAEAKALLADVLAGGRTVRPIREG